MVEVEQDGNTECLDVLECCGILWSVTELSHRRELEKMTTYPA